MIHVIKLGLEVSVMALCTYYLASIVQTLFHLWFGHRPRIRKLYEMHVGGHHAQYSKVLLTDKWVKTEQHVVWYYAIPFVPMLLIAFLCLPLVLFIVHIVALVFAIWWHIFLHRKYHIRGAWLERFEWFKRKRRLHLLHHRRPRKNYAIVEFDFDRLLGTYFDN